MSMIMQVALVKFSGSQNKNRYKTKDTKLGGRPVRTIREGGNGIRKG